MNVGSVMVIAGEASGDLLAAELVRELSAQATPFRPRFFGAGGVRMAAAGVELALDLTQHSVIGLIEVAKRYGQFRRIFQQLLDLALERQPDIIICVDFSGFNRRFAAAVRKAANARGGPFNQWRPRIVQYVSPQVWASRPGRAVAMARDFDLLLSIFPFEKKWYSERVPQLHVEFVGHPIIDRYAARPERAATSAINTPPTVLLLPGSRVGELNRHLPPLLGTVERIRQARPETVFRMVLPNEELRRLVTVPDNIKVQVGGLAEALDTATVALASTGTVTMECAYFGVPTVAFYKTSWSTYQIGKRIIQVKFLAMPNLLADELVFPEFVQDDATEENISRAALDLLNQPERRQAIQARLRQIITTLGEPGAASRAAHAILSLPAN